MKKQIGKALFLKLLLLAFISIGSVSADTLLSINDGWTETDDFYASGNDSFSFGGGGADSRFTFEISGLTNTWCIAANVGSERAGHYLLNGEEVYNLNMFEPYVWQDSITNSEITIQTRAGTGSTCSFWLWANKSDYCPDYWAATSAGYIGMGCSPNATGSLTEGSTQVYGIAAGGLGGVETTCINAISENYIKCQAPSNSELNDCIDDSFNNVNGGDNLALYEVCQDTGGTNSDADCDIQSGNSWELALFDTGHLSAKEQDYWIDGMPSTSFTIYDYDLCGTSLFERNLVETFFLQSYNSKQRVCSNVDDYNITGYVNGYKPWFSGSNTFLNQSYVYGSGTCGFGSVCSSSVVSSNPNFDLTVNACIGDTGSCYDGIINRDEIKFDYGGRCGSCDNTSSIDDIFFQSVYASHPKYYFDNNEFDKSVNCKEGEDTTFLTVIFIIITALVAIIVFLFSSAIIIYLLFLFSVPFIVRLFNRKRKKKI